MEFRANGWGVGGLPVKEDHGVPFRGHFEYFLDFCAEVGRVCAKFFGLEVIEWTSCLVGHCGVLVGILFTIEWRVQDGPASASKVFPMPGGPLRSDMRPCPVRY